LSRRRVLVCDAIDVDALGLGDGFEVDYRPGITREDLEARIANYEILIVRSRTKADASLIEMAPNLRMIARPGTGLDNIDLKAASARGIEVVNSPESLVEAVSEHVIGLMLAMARRLPAADASTRAGGWEKENMMGVEISGHTLGIIGLGRIGRRVAELARALGMNILGYDIAEMSHDELEKIGCKMVDLDTLFLSSDFITLHVPLSQETIRMVDQRRITMMKKTAFLVNASRGGVIDESALGSALRGGLIAGAALDVFEKEPPGPDILSAPNLIATPHIGGQTIEAQTRAAAAVGSKIRKHFRQ
jgi:D-3-phosphoglycerate dehydrogenase